MSTHIPTPTELALAQQALYRLDHLQSDLFNLYGSSSKELDTAILAGAEIEGWLYVVRRSGEVRRSFGQMIECCINIFERENQAPPHFLTVHKQTQINTGPAA